MPNNTKVLDVAKFFLEKENFMTHKKLQKLVYYAYVWYLVKSNVSIDSLENRLFASDIEAWVHGPVCRNLYDNYTFLKMYKNKELTEYEKNILNKVWIIYGKYTGAELENLTHKETPWKKAREGLSASARSCAKIKDRDMYEYYYKKLHS